MYNKQVINQVSMLATYYIYVYMYIYIYVYVYVYVYCIYIYTPHSMGPIDDFIFRCPLTFLRTPIMFHDTRG